MTLNAVAGPSTASNTAGSRTVCQDRLDLGLVALLQLDNGLGRERREHAGRIVARSVM